MSTRPPSRLVIDLWPTGGHGRQMSYFPVGVAAGYERWSFACVCMVWMCMTCKDVFISKPFPQGAGQFAPDDLQRKWRAHLTPDHPLP